ncbi:MAG: lmo0937 family membrane protein [Novosphingobium sp.]
MEGKTQGIPVYGPAPTACCGTDEPEMRFARASVNGAAKDWERSGSMWVTIALVLAVLWLLGVFAFKVTAGIIHILLLIALVALVMHFVRGRAL